MKGLVKSIALLSLLAGILAGGQVAGQPWSSTVGIKGGMNVSHLSVSGLTEESNVIGYHAGIFARLGLTPCFAIQPEALFSMKGAEVYFDNAFVKGGAIVRLNYMDVPVLAVIKFFPHLSLQAGPYFSYLIDASIKNSSENEGSDISSELNEDNFNRVDYGLVAGAGLEFRSMNFGVRYLQGLAEIGKEQTFFGQPYNFPDGKNSAWQVYLGFSFF
jgi:Outer membrane protein beta-barrel domain